jgi:hypothetical protein
MGRIRIQIRISDKRIRMAQNLMDPTDRDPDPEHWFIHFPWPALAQHASIMYSAWGMINLIRYVSTTAKFGISILLMCLNRALVTLKCAHLIRCLIQTHTVWVLKLNLTTS